jgi:hypothetical protein
VILPGPFLRLFNDLVALGDSLTELMFLDVAAHRYRVLSDEIDVPGRSVMSNVLAAALSYVLRKLATQALLYGGNEFLTIPFVRDSLDLDISFSK